MRATIDTAVTRTSALVLVLAMTLSCTRQQATEPRAEPASAVPPAADVQRTKAALVGPTRTEHDLLGEKEIPADAYYGVQTARALENFRIELEENGHRRGRQVSEFCDTDQRLASMTRSALVDCTTKLYGYSGACHRRSGRRFC